MIPLKCKPLAKTEVNMLTVNSYWNFVKPILYQFQLYQCYFEVQRVNGNGKTSEWATTGDFFYIANLFFLFLFSVSPSAKPVSVQIVLLHANLFFLYRQGSFISALVRELTSKNDFTHRVSYTVT